jgi:HlyD family secretion protein
MADTFLPEVDQLNLPGLKPARTIYWIIVGFVITAFVAMPLIKIDVVVTAPGIIRPISERTCLRAMVTGTIHRLPFKDGDYIRQNSVVVTIKNNVSDSKIQSAQFEFRERAAFRRDLEKLTRPKEISVNVLTELESPLYKQQASRYLFEISNLLASIEKVNRELKTDSILFSERVISGKEYYDKKTEASKIIAAYHAFTSQQ